MNILILGGDGYLGWPAALFFSKKDHKVTIIDNFSKKKIEFENSIKPLVPQTPIKERLEIWNKNSNTPIKFEMCDLLNHRSLYDLLKQTKPDAIIHFAEQPSAPYSMKGREACFFTQNNNVLGTINLLFAMKKYSPEAHLIKLGTMGEYGTPNIDIEEGWIDIEHKGRKDRVLYPKKPGSFYHLSKVHDTNNIEFATRVWKFRCTDLNQGVVYGVDTDETKLSEKLSTSFHYDEIFGTVINRFCIQAALGLDLTIYGNGTQQRGYLDIRDTLNCINITLENPAKESEFRVFNQYSEKLSINQIAKIVIDAAKDLNISVSSKKIANPRVEQEDHYYNPTNTNLVSLGLKPLFLNKDIVKTMIDRALKYKNNILRNTISPTIKWKN